MVRHARLAVRLAPLSQILWRTDFGARDQRLPPAGLDPRGKLRSDRSDAQWSAPPVHLLALWSATIAALTACRGPVTGGRSSGEEPAGAILATDYPGRAFECPDTANAETARLNKLAVATN